MKISDLLYETWSALTANKGRSLLTILGIVIGIAAVIAMTSLIGGVKQALVSELGLDQSRVIYITFYNEKETTADDLASIKNGVEGYELVTGIQYYSGKASSGSKQIETSIMGVSSGYFRASSPNLSAGRLLTDTELNQDSMSIVVDAIFVRELFGDSASAVGKKVAINNDNYTIVGVVESSDMFGNTGTVYMPATTCFIRVSGYSDFNQIIGYAKEGVDLDALSRDTEDFIKEHFGITDEDLNGGYAYLYVQSIESIQKEFDSTMAAFQMLMTAVASISLIVGGIGIMNMMLTNVTERIREIGLRKALGAHKSDITLQFLFESVALCLVGGIIGFIVGVAGAWAVAAVAGGAMGSAMAGDASMSITPAVSWATVLTAVGICVGIGILFGYWPARRAAKLDPVESLRYQ